MLFKIIQQADVAMLLLINRKAANPVFDVVMPWLRQSVVWIPLYFFLIVFGLLNLGKKAWWWIGTAIMTVALSDQVSSGIVKNTVARLRPCTDPEVLPLIQLRLAHCSGAFSFTSSHAANHFSLAMFIVLSLAPLTGTKVTRWLFVWAGLIGFAQIYVGVHYPLDVLFGSLLGLGCGWLTYKVYGRLTANIG